MLCSALNLDWYGSVMLGVLNGHGHVSLSTWEWEKHLQKISFIIFWQFKPQSTWKMESNTY